MPRFGFVVGGTSDEKAVKEIAKKCLGNDCHVETRKWDEKGGLHRRFPISLEEFKSLHIDKAFVLRDTDGKNPDDLLASMQARIAGQAYPFVVTFAYAIEELEAWFLADHEAIGQVIGRPVDRIADAIENIPSPKDNLLAILSRAKHNYTSETARKIASQLDVDVVARRCPAFRQLCRAIGDC